MPHPSWLRPAVPWLVLGLLAVPSPGAEEPAEVPPIVYTLRFPQPADHMIEVEAVVPTAGRESVELMMALWSPGYYRREDYADRVREISARTAAGEPLAIEASAANRWRVASGGADPVVVAYRLAAKEKSVTLNWVSRDLGVINGSATFITRVEEQPRPHEVHLELPAVWARSMSALDPAPGGPPESYRAADFDILLDSPILAGDLALREFEVAGSRHLLVSGGDLAGWDIGRAARDLETMVVATRQFWGFLPFERYVFLNVHREGGGGLEHRDSTLVTAQPSRLGTPEGYAAWLGLTTHEYFHAFNVERLRPAELAAYDYEAPPEIPSLWISEGLTTYFAELILCRSGLSSRERHLAALAGMIGRLQRTPGRRFQSLEESSRLVWETSRSGLAERPETTVSYYLKGPLVGFLLDVEVQRASGGRARLDDALRLAYRRYSADRGFTAAGFAAVVEEVAGADLGAWLRRAVETTEELDFDPALEWYGLRFVAAEGEAEEAPGALEVRGDATEAQQRRLAAWLGPSP